MVSRFCTCENLTFTALPCHQLYLWKKALPVNLPKVTTSISTQRHYLHLYLDPLLLSLSTIITCTDLYLCLESLTVSLSRVINCITSQSQHLNLFLVTTCISSQSHYLYLCLESLVVSLSRVITYISSQSQSRYLYFSHCVHPSQCKTNH